MGFLKKFGLAILQGVQIVSGVAPLIQQFVPAGAARDKVAAGVSDLQAIGGIVQMIEVAGTATNQTGAQKLAMASPLIKQIILSSDMLAAHKIQDPVKFNAGVDKITSGFADVLSSLEAKVDTTDKT